MESAVLLALGGDARWRLDEGACLPLRNEFGRCRACQSACPAGVIEVSVERVSVSDGCTHCGRCAAACPVSAIYIDGFEKLDLPATSAGPIELECAKVPADARSADAIVVPCLGGISPGRLAALNERAAGREVRLIDRGWCGQCKAGCGPAHPAQAAVHTVALWLHAVDESVAAPHIVLRALPLARMPADIPFPDRAPDPGPAMTRRQFFRTLAESPLGRPRTPMGTDGRPAFPARSRRESPERRRLLDVLAAAAQRAGKDVPAEFFPRLANNGACGDHRVCTAACPTGALKVVEAGETAALTFAATACIACGACTRACPEGVLALDPHGGRPEIVTVASHVRSPCASCGEAFSPRPGETLCLACRKSQRLLHDAMSRLFAARQ